MHSSKDGGYRGTVIEGEHEPANAESAFVVLNSGVDVFVLLCSVMIGWVSCLLLVVLYGVGYDDGVVTSSCCQLSVLVLPVVSLLVLVSMLYDKTVNDSCTLHSSCGVFALRNPVHCSGAHIRRLSRDICTSRSAQQTRSSSGVHRASRHQFTDSAVDILDPRSPREAQRQRRRQWRFLTHSSATLQKTAGMHHTQLCSATEWNTVQLQNRGWCSQLEAQQTCASMRVWCSGALCVHMVLLRASPHVLFLRAGCFPRVLASC